MNNFNKRAVFAALMGALSSVSAFAMENNTKGCINNNQHPRAKSVQPKKQGKLSFLSPDDPKLDDKINQINKIWLITFVDDESTKQNRNPSFLSERNLMKRIMNSISDGKPLSINTLRDLKDRRAQYGKKQGQLVKRTKYLNPGLDLNDSISVNKMMKRMQIPHEQIVQILKSGKRVYLVYTNDTGQVEGYTEFIYTDRQKKHVYIEWLANAPNKNNQGLGSQMLKFMQSNFSKLELQPANEKAKAFYEHFGFVMVDKKNNIMSWQK